jgi:hypothetical protein
MRVGRRHVPNQTSEHLGRKADTGPNALCYLGCRTRASRATRHCVPPPTSW